MALQKGVGIWKKGKGNIDGNSVKAKAENIFLFKSIVTTSQLANTGSKDSLGIEKYVEFKDLLSSTGNTIISGGIISWIKDYDYIAPKYSYIIRGNTYSFSPIDFSVDEADTVNGYNRKDVVVGTFDNNGKGLLKVKKGTPALIAIKPFIDQNTEIELTTIDVDFNTTQPAGVDNLVIYDEGVEATNSDNTGGRIDFTYPTLPFSQLNCIKLTAFTTGDEISFLLPTPFTPSEQESVQFQIDSLETRWANAGTIKIGFFDGLTQVSDFVIIDSTILNKAGNPYAFESPEIGWQNVLIPVTAFNFISSSATICKIIKDDNKGAETFKLDLIRLQSGVGGINPTIIITSTAQLINEGADRTSTYVEAKDIKPYIEAAGISITEDTNKFDVAIKYATLPVIPPTANDFITFMGGTDSLVSAITPLNTFPLSLLNNDLEISYLSVVNGDLNTNLNAVIRYLNTDGEYWLASASNSLKSTTELVATNDILIPTGTTLKAIKKGVVTGYTGLVVGGKYYLDTATGGITNDTSLFASTDIIRYVGTAISKSAIYFNPSVPTPDSSISIRNSNDVEQFSGNYIQFDGVDFDIPNKRIIGTALQRNTLFLSSTGNDATAQENNPKAPFLTLDGAVTYLLAQGHLGLNWHIETLDTGTFTYTLSSKVLNGFNIINSGASTIVIQNAIEVVKQWIFDFKTGTLIFDYTDNTTLLSDSFIFNGTNGLYMYTWQNVSNVIVRNSTTLQSDVSRGILRSLGNIDKFLWQNVAIEQGGFKLVDNGSANDKEMVLGDITNYNDTVLSGKEIFRTDNATYRLRVKFNLYDNQSTVSHKIGYAPSSYNPHFSVRHVNSPNAITTIHARYLNLNNSANWLNCNIAPNLLNNKVIFNGNGFRLYVNSTINIGLFASIRQTKANQNIQLTDYTRLKNIHLIVDALALISCIGYFDIREGEQGGQLEIDNCDIEFKNGDTLFEILEQSSTFIAKNQVIFRNSVRIINGNNLHDDGWTTTPAGILQDIFVKENASIYHDFGVISANANFQATIPNISTY